jgi:hypothetical protein
MENPTCSDMFFSDNITCFLESERAGASVADLSPEQRSHHGHRPRADKPASNNELIGIPIFFVHFCLFSPVHPFSSVFILFRSFSFIFIQFRSFSLLFIRSRAFSSIPFRFHPVPFSFIIPPLLTRFLGTTASPANRVDGIGNGTQTTGTGYDRRHNWWWAMDEERGAGKRQ